MHFKNKQMPWFYFKNKEMPCSYSTGILKKKHLLLTVPEALNSKITVLADSVSAGPLLVQECCLLAVSLPGRLDE